MRHQSGPGRMTSLSLKRTSAGSAGSCMWQTLLAPSGTCAMLGVRRLTPIILQFKHLPLLNCVLCVKQRHLDDHVLHIQLSSTELELACIARMLACVPHLHAAMCMRFGTSHWPADPASASSVSFIMLMCITSTCVGHTKVCGLRIAGLGGPYFECCHKL